MPEPPKSLPDDAGGLARMLGIELRETTAERVVATMPVTPDHHQPFGYLHGGASVALAETVVSVGGYLAAPDGHSAMGLEINANHVRSKRAGRLTATAEPVHVGRSTQVWQVEITDEQDRLICTSRCTLAVVEQRES